ncbi:TetR/AcrR family transcriptional regulator [Salimicrobium jeotgali]|uniref:TetR/AcrR family transcriptional regulator n=1 Tax=Salimicrobium jeotgali TaxID=1230341 RepID=UPI000C815209|nr:TetR/AcrR family transcriptional regulator [Salimicrobium jeotgali]
MKEKSTKEKLLSAMYEMLGKQGYDKTSIRQLADAIGIKKASVYYYFRYKEEILVELVKHLYAQDSEDNSLRTLKTPNEFREYLFNMGYSLVDTFETNEVANKVFAEIDIQTNRVPALRKYVDDYIWGEKERLCHIVEYGKTIGAVPKEMNSQSIADYLFIVQTGIDDALLYHYQVDCKEVWSLAVKNILGGE